MLNFSFHFNFLPSFLSSQSKSLFSFLSKHKKKEDKPSYFLVLCNVICSDKQGQVVYSLNKHVFSLFKNNIKETIPSVVSSSINLNTSLSVFLTTTLSHSLFSHPFSKTPNPSHTTNPHPGVVVFLSVVFLLLPPIPSNTNLLKTTTKHSSCVSSLSYSIPSVHHSTSHTLTQLFLHSYIKLSSSSYPDDRV